MTRIESIQQRLPEQPNIDPEQFEHQTGEVLDDHSSNFLKHCHDTLRRFPELTARYSPYSEATRTISTLLITATTIAFLSRVRDGHSPKQIVEELTPEDILRAPQEERKRTRKMLKRLALDIKRQVTKKRAKIK